MATVASRQWLLKLEKQQRPIIPHKKQKQRTQPFIPIYPYFPLTPISTQP